MSAFVLIHVKGTGRKCSSAWSHHVQCLRQAIRKPQPAKCNLISIFYALPLGLNLFYSIHSHSWRRVHALHAWHHVSNLPSSLMFWQYFSFRMERVQSVTQVKVSSFSLEMDWPFSAAPMWVCALQGTMASGRSCSWHYSVAGRDVVIGWINSHLWLNDAEIWILNRTFQSNKQRMSNACSTYIVLERTNWKVCLPFVVLSEWVFAFILDHLRFGVCLLTTWQLLTKPVPSYQLPSINQLKSAVHSKISLLPTLELPSLSLPEHCPWLWAFFILLQLLNLGNHHLHRPVDPSC